MTEVAALPPPPLPLPESAAPLLPGLTPAVPEGKDRTLRIVAPGDTLAGLTFQVYGRVDRPMLDMIQKHNPDIANIDRIWVGQVIEFPTREDGRP